MAYAKPIQNQCIQYRIPLYELDRARQGVPMEELDKLTEPTIVKSELNQFGFFYMKNKKKYGRE